MKIIKTVLILIVAISLLISLVFGHRDKTVAELKEKYAPAPSSFLKMDGMDVHYRDEGNPNDSIPIVLIHGTGASLHTFDNWASMLTKARFTEGGQSRVVRMDLPAYGLTGPFPSQNYTMGNYVDFIEHFLNARGIKHCILGGNSLGGLIAWQFALKNKGMVDKLILIDAAGYAQKSKNVPIAFRMARIPFLNKIFTFITPRFVIKSSVENVYADKTKVTDAIIDRYFDLSLRAGNRQAFVGRTALRDSNQISQIHTLQQPTLVLWGEQDGLIPVENAYHFHDDLPNDTLVILKNMGHVPMEENPSESLKPVLDFLRKK
jgi:pimeloyl-ACP methyl ester carboxylesterase